jgi:hypothetical protein
VGSGWPAEAGGADPRMNDDPIDRLTPEELDPLIDSWADPAYPLSQHIRLAIAAAVHRRRRNLPPLRDGEPIPGCDCPHCTGVSKDAPARVVPIATRYRRAAYRKPLDVEAAKRVPILEVARRIGWEVDPRRPYVRCPFHDDQKPSMHLNTRKNAAFCNPCGRSWDPIALYREVRGLDFPTAVRELAA